MDWPRGFRRRGPRTGQGRPARTIFVQCTITGVGQDVRRCRWRTSTGADPGQGKARKVCSARNLSCCRLDIVQCLLGADHLSTGERWIRFICPVEQHNKRRRGKRKVANQSRGEADAARGENVGFESILQSHLLGQTHLPYKPEHKNDKSLCWRQYYGPNPLRHYEKQTSGEQVPFAVRKWCRHKGSTTNNEIPYGTVCEHHQKSDSRH